MATARTIPLGVPGPAAQPNPRRWLGLLALAVSVLTVIMTATSVNVALPAISAAFGTSISNLTWVIDAYTLALGALTLPGGTLGDIFGRRRVYLIGLALFSLGALLSSAAPSLVILTGGRVVMGVGAALVLPGTLSLISSMFEGRERATAIGLWGGMNGVGLAAGPIIGGVLVEYVDWRAVFWINLPLVAIAFAMVPRYVPKIPARAGLHQMDLPGALTITFALIGLITGLIQGQTWGWSDPRTLGCFVAAAVLLVAFIVIERSVRWPMVPLAIFRSRTFCAANLSAGVLMLGVLSSFFFLSLFLQDVLGYSSVRAGLAYLPMAVFMSGLAPLAGRLSTRFGPRLPIIAGLVSAAAGVAWMSRIDGHSGYGSLAGGLMLVGIGMGLGSPAISNAAISSVPAALAGAASGMNAMTRQVGGAFGIALLTAIFSNRFAGHLGAALASSHLPAATQQRVYAAAANVTGGTPAAHPDPRIFGLIHTAFALGMADTLTFFAAIAGAGVAVALLIRRSDFVQARSVVVEPAQRGAGAPIARTGAAR